MDEFPLMINDHTALLQGHGMLGGAEGCLGIRSSSAAVLPPPQGKAVPTQDDRNKNKGKDSFYSDWPELVLLDDFETGLRTFDPSPRFEIGSKYFEDTLWSPIYSAEAELVPGSYFDNISFSVDRNETTTLTPKPANPTTESRPQSRNGASDTPLNCDAHPSSSSSISDAELFLQFDDLALVNQMGGCEGLEAIFCPSQRAPTASSAVLSDETVASSTFSGPELAPAHIIPRPLEKPHDPFRGAPDMVLEEMAENPLDMYFPPVTAYEQPELLLSDSTPAPERHRSPPDMATSYALNYAELQFYSKDMASVALNGQPSSAVPVKDLGFHKLQEGMNRLDLATKGRIRDALYRLANSVEQRHRVGGTSGGVASSGSKRFRSGGWTETQLKSNPMDQSVAQLLLQKPSYQKTVPLPPHRVT
ncbi:hypothetical protein U9M48_021905 [Paspalum notatum var. saurae]|uniref:Uncharacterized protein n=1 Tax=Paspalum notatum var. saurae TaxID=547442 RepID=A0AAQ3TGM8_PASNO